MEEKVGGRSLGRRGGGKGRGRVEKGGGSSWEGEEGGGGTREKTVGRRSRRTMDVGGGGDGWRRRMGRIEECGGSNWWRKSKVEVKVRGVRWSEVDEGIEYRLTDKLG